VVRHFCKCTVRRAYSQVHSCKFIPCKTTQTYRALFLVLGICRTTAATSMKRNCFWNASRLHCVRSHVSNCSSKFTVKRDCCFDKQPRTKHHCSANSAIRILGTRAIFSTFNTHILDQISLPSIFQYLDRFFLLRKKKNNACNEKDGISWRYKTLFYQYIFSEILHISAFLLNYSFISREDSETYSTWLTHRIYSYPFRIA